MNPGGYDFEELLKMFGLSELENVRARFGCQCLECK